MGGALAGHLVGKHALTVLDLDRALVDSFVERGARAAESPADLAQNCDYVFLCLPRSSDVRKVLFGRNGLMETLRPGSVVIDQTSGQPGETRGFAQTLQERGVALVDAPVSGAMATAIAGTISVIASGPQPAFERVRTLLNDISLNVFYVGEVVGSGQTMKSVNNMMNASCRLGTLELVALGRKFGLSLEVMIEACNATTARNFTTRGMLPAIAEGRQSTNFGLALQIKDCNQAVALGHDKGVSMPLSSLVCGMLQIGLNTLGPGAQLEQMIGVVESMANAHFVQKNS